MIQERSIKLIQRLIKITLRSIKLIRTRKLKLQELHNYES